LETTIREFLPKTFNENFLLFEKYPEYRYSFEGSYRYELLEEYYPEAFEKIKEYVAQGRWNVTGSAYENGDVNIPSPEALFRNILFGNDYFDKRFGKRSVDIFLPDCFGFGYALPSIMNHANLLGFTTQKLVWSSAYHIPFDLGIWRGVDGNAVYASFDAMNYTKVLRYVRGYHPVALSLRENLFKYDLPFTFVFHGVGDRGGAPKEPSVKVVCDEIKKNPSSRWDVLSAPADRVFRDMNNELSEEQKQKLPVWNNELVSTDHGVGGYTSRAIGTRWNRRGEQLASAAERACVNAMMAGDAPYPREVLNIAWKRLIAHQFHDDITGTSLVKCYQRNWNDYILSLNQFGEEYRAASGAVASRLDTAFAKGTPVVVSNPVQCAGKRTETVTASVELGEFSGEVAVFDADGNAVPAGVVSRGGGRVEVAFSASVPSVGYTVYDVRAVEKAPAVENGLRVTKSLLENDKYIVKIDANGDIFSIIDKNLQRELLHGPIRFAVFSYNGSISWPAWELDYHEISAPPKAYAKNARVEILESHAARVSLKITKTAGKSTFVQVVSLDRGGEFVRVQNEVDWRSMRSLLKVEFPLAPENNLARYDLGLGNIARGSNTKMLFEVPAQMWADLSDVNNSWGVSVLSDSKTGWDKPDSHALRMTVVHTPKHRYRDESAQHLMDLGLNRFGFAIYSHSGGVRQGTVLAAENFNQPMNAFVTENHKGDLGSEHSFCSVSDNGVIIRALKKAENSDEIVVRFNETENKIVKDVCFTLTSEIDSAREIYASEENLCPAQLVDGALRFDIGAFGVKSFALTLKNPLRNRQRSASQIVLPYNAAITTANNSLEQGLMPEGMSIPAELFPKTIVSGQQVFALGQERLNALQCKGQKLALSGNAARVFLLASAVNGDRQAVFQTGKTDISIEIADMFERVGVWDMVAVGEAAHIKRHTLAWNVTHMHSRDGDIFAKQAYIFKYELDLPKKCKELTLPDDENLFIFAAIEEADSVRFDIGAPLYDCAEKRAMDYWITEEDLRRSQPSKTERRHSHRKFIKTYVVNRALREVGILKYDKNKD
jgi:alpha-mannosidase